MYFKLNREERKVIRNKYQKTKRGENLLTLYNRLVIDGIACLSCAAALVFFIATEAISKYFYILVGILIFASLVFVIGQYILKIKEYNKFIAKNKR